jgi:hypothetical protein
MTLYALVLFCHVAAAVGLFAALTVEWASLRRMGASSSYEQARDWSELSNLLLPLGMPSTLVVLASGVYLASTLDAWVLGWVKVAVPTLVTVAIVGGVVGPRRNRLRADLATGSGALPTAMRRQLQYPLFVASWRCRASLLGGLLFLMTTRPQPLWIVGAFAAVGIAWSLPAWVMRRQN